MNEGHDTSTGFTPLFADRGGADSTVKRSIEPAKLALEPTPQAVRDYIIREKMDHQPSFYSSNKRGRDDDPTSAGFHPLSEGHSSPPRGSTMKTIAPNKTAQFENPEEMAAIQNLILETQGGSRSPPSEAVSKAYVPNLLASPRGNLNAEMAATKDTTIIDSTTKKVTKDAVAQAAAAALLACEESDGSSDEEDASTDEEDDNSQAQTTLPTGDYIDGHDFPHTTNAQQTPAPQPKQQNVPLSFLRNTVHSVDAAARIQHFDMSPDCGMSTTMFPEGCFNFSDEAAALSPQFTATPALKGQRVHQHPHNDRMHQVIQKSIPTPQVKGCAPFSLERPNKNDQGKEDIPGQATTDPADAIHDHNTKNKAFDVENVQDGETTICKTSAIEAESSNPASPCRITAMEGDDIHNQEARPGEPANCWNGVEDGEQNQATGLEPIYSPRGLVTTEVDTEMNNKNENEETKEPQKSEESKQTHAVQIEALGYMEGEQTEQTKNKLQKSEESKQTDIIQKEALLQGEQTEEAKNKVQKSEESKQTAILQQEALVEGEETEKEMQQSEESKKTDPPQKKALVEGESTIEQKDDILEAAAATKEAQTSTITREKSAEDSKAANLTVQRAGGKQLGGKQARVSRKKKSRSSSGKSGKPLDKENNLPRRNAKSKLPLRKNKPLAEDEEDEPKRRTRSSPSPRFRAAKAKSPIYKNTETLVHATEPTEAAKRKRSRKSNVKSKTQTTTGKNAKQHETETSEAAEGKRPRKSNAKSKTQTNTRKNAKQGEGKKTSKKVMPGTSKVEATDHETNNDSGKPLQNTATGDIPVAKELEAAAEITAQSTDAGKGNVAGAVQRNQGDSSRQSKTTKTKFVASPSISDLATGIGDNVPSGKTSSENCTVGDQGARTTITPSANPQKDPVLAVAPKILNPGRSEQSDGLDQTLNVVTASESQNVVPVSESQNVVSESLWRYADNRITSPTPTAAAATMALEAANKLMNKSPDLVAAAGLVDSSNRKPTEEVGTMTCERELSLKSPESVAAFLSPHSSAPPAEEVKASSQPETTPPPAEEVKASPPLETTPKIPMDDEDYSCSDPTFDDLSRTVNPLLGFRIGNEPWQLDPEDNEPPHVSEILQLSEIYFPQPDTFPISYYARLLGYNAPALPIGFKETRDKIDEVTFSVPRDEIVQSIPPEGRVWSMWQAQESRNVKLDAIEHWDPLLNTFVKQGWDEDYLFSFSPKDGVMYMNRFIEQAKECDVSDTKNWVVNPINDERPHVWGVQAHNKLEPENVYDLCFQFEHYAVVAEDESFDRLFEEGFEGYPIVLRLHVANLEQVLVIDDKGGGPNNPVLLLLFGLVVEVGRSCGAKFCLLELSRHLVEVLQNHFWMAKVEDTDNRGIFGPSAGEREKWVCDLSRSSLNHALLHRASVTNNIVNQRLRVVLQTEERERAPDRRRRASKGARKDQTYSSATGSTRRAFVGLRVKKDSKSNPSGINLHFINKKREEGKACPSRKKLSVSHDWKVLDSFPLPMSNSPFSEISVELKQKIQELQELENKGMKKMNFLMEEVVKERREYDRPENVIKRKKKQKIMEEYEKRHCSGDIGRTWQQLEDDMEATCVICNEGEVTPHNWIVICDGCEAPLHQDCYGIEEVPKGKFFCRPCQLMRDNVISEPEEPVCELCPLPGGAFFQIESSKEASPKWVHVVCANWQNLKKVDPFTYEDPRDIIENHRMREIACCLCQGTRGAFSQCQHKRCKNFMHVTCARHSELCDVKNGQPGNEMEEKTIFCPKHSTESDGEPRVSVVMPIDELVRYAEIFPPAPTPFPNQTSDEQRQSLMDPDYEQDFLHRVGHSLPGARCDVCSGHYGEQLVQCQGCRARICACCTELSENNRFQKGAYLCGGCLHKAAEGTPKQDCGTPKCSVCPQKSGWLRKATATPMPRQVKRFKQDPELIGDTLFSKQLWCHTICGRAHIDRTKQDTEAGLVDFSNAILTNGHSFIKPQTYCSLCGNNGGLKKRCNTKGCKSGLHGKWGHALHATCAWQAGFTVAPAKIGDKIFGVSCLEHSDLENNLRAKIEDLIDLEETRIKRRGSWGDVPMTFDEAASVLNASTEIMRIIGWAWRWEEWWVKHNFNWEPFIPFLEEGQTEDDFTDEEKRIVVSTRESRRADADSCSLGSFGAAVRNRNYDTDNGFDNNSLHRALRAILTTKSLVGPLKDFEIDFIEDWLGRAYRSKSRHLGFGDDKVEIGTAKFCYEKDKSPKFELAGRPLPGKDLSVTSESDNEEVNDKTDNIVRAALGADKQANQQDDASGHDKDVTGRAVRAAPATIEGRAAGCITRTGEGRKVGVPETWPGQERHAGTGQVSLDDNHGMKAHNSPTPAVPLATEGKMTPVPNIDRDDDSATVTEPSVLIHQGIVERNSLESEAQNKRAKTRQQMPSSAPGAEKPTRRNLSPNCCEENQIQELQSSNATAENPEPRSLSKKSGRPLSSKRTRGDDAVEQEMPPTKVSKAGGHNTNKDSATSTANDQSCSSSKDTPKRTLAAGIGPKNQASKKRPFHKIDENLGKHKGGTKDKEEYPSDDDEDPCSEDEEWVAGENSDDDGSAETVKTVLTVRTRKDDLQDAAYKEAFKKMQLKSPPVKAKPLNRLSNVTAATTKLTASPARTYKSSMSRHHMAASPARTYKSGMSRRLKPTKPFRGVSFGKPTTMGPTKVGIKGSSVNEDEVEDDGPADDATFSGQSLHLQHHDDFSVLTEFTHFPKQIPEEEKSRTSYGSDANTIQAATKKATNDGFSVCGDTEFPRHDNCCRHQAVYYGYRVRGECVQCSRGGQAGVKTRFGCPECFILAFEHRYKVQVDRNNIPAYFKQKAVFLCAEEEEGETSCFDRWHAKDTL